MHMQEHARCALALTPNPKPILNPSVCRGRAHCAPQPEEARVEAPTKREAVGQLLHPHLRPGLGFG